MAFFIKDFASIAAGMLNWFRLSQDRVTDLEPGSVARTLMEAPAAEIEQLYLQMFHGIRDAIPVAVYRSFGFDPLPAQPARGVIRVTIAAISSDTLIPAGTVFTPTGGGTAAYISSAPVTIVAGNTFADVGVAADMTGVTTNLPAGSAFTASPTPPSFVAATTTSGMTGGADAEADDARRSRFAAYLASLERSTHRALQYAATLAATYDAAGIVTERVTSAVVVEPYTTNPVLYGPGLVWVYVENREGVPSAALIQRCQQIIDGYTEAGVTYPGYKAAGIQVQVFAAGRTAVNVAATLTLEVTADVAATRAAVADSIAFYLDNLSIAQPAYRSEMIALAMEVPGVLNCILTLPVSDTLPGNTEKIVPGTVTIS